MLEKRSLSDKPPGEGKLSEKTLGEISRLQEMIVNALDCPVLFTTPEGVITTFNPSAEHLLGYTSEEMIGKATPLVYHDPNEIRERAGTLSRSSGNTIQPGFRVLTEKASRTKSPDDQQWTLIRKDGTRFPATVAMAALRDEKGNLIGFAGTITDRSQRTKPVVEENMLYFNNPVNLNALTDFKGKLKKISSSWAGLLKWSEEELKSKQFLDFIHPEDVERTAATFKSLMEGSKVLTLENRVVDKNGLHHWLLWRAARVPEEKLIYASAIDITERKQSEDNILDAKSSLETLAHKLQEQNRQLDEFAHIISHNLRAPVNNIQALINLLDDNSVIADYKLIFDKIRNVAKNLNETMNEVMDTLKVKTQPNSQSTEIRFKEVLDKVVQSLEGELIVAQASVTFDFNGAPAIHYSKPYMESIFQNLLTNAVKYRSPKRKPMIHFQSSVVNDHVELHVTDNGQGIDMERFGDKIFGLHKTFHEHQEARGVGLFLTKTQIEAMGGTISVESEVDKGTTFIIRFSA